MSDALTNYLAANTNVAALLALEGGFRDPPGLQDQAAVEGLRGGCVVLMVAGFENYLKEAIAEVFDRINSASPACEFHRLPLLLQAQAVYTGLNAAMNAKPWDSLKDKQLRLPGVLAAVARISRGEILSQEIAETAGNPNSDQVKSVFRTVGLSNVFGNIKPGFDAAWGGPTAQTFIANNLDAVVQRRHVVAHTASILSTSRTDLHEWKRFLQCFVSQLDAALERHIGRVIRNAQ
ncbi:HEPN domain-containing protein [Agrococcus baldri]|uniref:RiboL-PSP-HEPN domain-containing protein n=1 Tax=Agrococcus baldri TaxID=153730 RepID=A0AA87RLR8_9MICO|nr:HEPN domain-containing protein [Agrococcus baldri]GEK81353.1 hypothetical protein ABA31_27040 [Agrococcus baldri]